MDNFDFNFIKTESEEAIEQTLDGISRVSSIVKAMKTFSHPGTSDKKNLIDINKSIETTLTISKKNEWKYHCNVITDFDPNLPEVYGYHDDLNQVFLNMIINASHSIEEKYSKENKMGNITISTHATNDHAIISIADDGLGISKENLNKVFNPFFTTKTVGKGTGQGLSICHSIIEEKHKGKINIQTTEGKGATFIIKLPLL